MDPLISIVIPSYNHARYIGKALDSIISQTFSGWEVIVVDNHSTDDTDSVLASYKDERIRHCKINNEGVIAKSRNKGVQEARGNWVAFLDSDDWWAPSKLQECRAVMNDDVDLIYHNMWIFHDGERETPHKIMLSGALSKPVLSDLLIRGNCIINSSVVVRKEILDQVGGVDENRDLITAEDYHCWLKIAVVTENFYYLEQVLGGYRIHQQGMSQKDVIKQTRLAVEDFLPSLNVREILYTESFIRYFRIVNRQQVISSSDLLKDVFFCLKYGKMEIKLKAMVVSMKIYAKRWIGTGK